MLYTRFKSPIPAVILLIPIHLIFNPSLIVFVMNPKMCSTRTRILLFFRLLFFCLSVKGCPRYPHGKFVLKLLVPH